MPEQKPNGSGWFAAGSGAVFLIAFICSFIWDLTRIPPYLLFKSMAAYCNSNRLGLGCSQNRDRPRRFDDWS
jgi:hypothetical protein